jgi:hypothetical protein
MTTPEEIRTDIVQHRAELAETVDLLADKLNVKAQAAKKVEPLQPYKGYLYAGAGGFVALLVLLKVRKARGRKR